MLTWVAARISHKLRSAPHYLYTRWRWWLETTFWRLCFGCSAACTIVQMKLPQQLSSMAGLQNKVWNYHQLHPALSRRRHSPRRTTDRRWPTCLRGRSSPSGPSGSAAAAPFLARWASPRAPTRSRRAWKCARCRCDGRLLQEGGGERRRRRAHRRLQGREWMKMNYFSSKDMIWARGRGTLVNHLTVDY